MLLQTQLLVELMLVCSSFVACSVLPMQQVIDLSLYCLLTIEMHLHPPPDKFLLTERVMLVFLSAYPDDCW
jgi:hypothetical protein